MLGDHDFDGPVQCHSSVSFVRFGSASCAGKCLRHSGGTQRLFLSHRTWEFGGYVEEMHFLAVRHGVCLSIVPGESYVTAGNVLTDQV